MSSHYYFSYSALHKAQLGKNILYNHNKQPFSNYAFICYMVLFSLNKQIFRNITITSRKEEPLHETRNRSLREHERVLEPL